MKLFNIFLFHQPGSSQKYLKSKQMFCAAAELRTFQLGFQKLDMHLKSLHSAAEKVLERGK